LFMSLVVRCVSCRQQIVGSCFFDPNRQSMSFRLES
jgi:hypothetical protein